MNPLRKHLHDTKGAAAHRSLAERRALLLAQIAAERRTLGLAGTTLLKPLRAVDAASQRAAQFAADYRYLGYPLMPIALLALLRFRRPSVRAIGAFGARLPALWRLYRQLALRLGR